MLSIENLTCRRAGRVVLDSLELQVAPREIVALVGPANSGKTTALECVIGLHVPASGRVRVGNVDILRRATEAQAHLAYVPAELSLPEKPRVFAYLRETCERAGRCIPDAALTAALLRGGVSEAWHGRRLVDCPANVRRKLALTVAVLKNADTLLLDEPTGDLDGGDIDALVASFRRLRKRGAAMLIATRDLPFAQRLATRVVFLEHGAVIETVEPNASREAFQVDSYLARLVA